MPKKTTLEKFLHDGSFGGGILIYTATVKPENDDEPTSREYAMYSNLHDFHRYQTSSGVEKRTVNKKLQFLTPPTCGSLHWELHTIEIVRYGTFQSGEDNENEVYIEEFVTDSGQCFKFCDGESVDHKMNTLYSQQIVSAENNNE